MVELTGRRLGLSADMVGDYEAFHEGVALVDMSDRGRMRFSGPGARNALNGVLTCDVAPLQAGEGSYGVALTSKGKVVADVSLFANADSFLIECPATAWAGWQQLVLKYINPRLAARQDETEATASLGLFGPDASRIAAVLSGCDKTKLESLAMYSHVDYAIDSGSVNIAHVPDMGVDGYRLLGARPLIESLHRMAIQQRARGVAAPAVECARIESGRPLWGVDMDDSTLPQEANLDVLGAISYTKGCYTGQEVVARLHFRGHVNRRLMGLRIDGSERASRGTEVTGIEGASCGDVRSSIVSPRFGPIALAMIRREVDSGARVTLRIGGVATEAEVVALPFGG